MAVQEYGGSDLEGVEAVDEASAERHSSLKGSISVMGKA